MKQTINRIAILLFSFVPITVRAVSDSLQHPRNYYLPPWSLETNFGAGNAWLQPITMKSLVNSFPNLTSTSSQNYLPHASGSNGISQTGLDLMGFHYFGGNHFLGIGTGIIGNRQEFHATMNELSLQYQSTYAGNIFKQIIISNGIQENDILYKIGVPFLLRIKSDQFRKPGFFIDVGGFLGISEISKYSTNAIFDYEAIYERKEGQWVYDNSPALPESQGTQIILTKDYILAHNPALAGSIDEYFHQLRNTGQYNVGLDQHIQNSGRAYFTRLLNGGGMVRSGISYNANSRILYTLSAYAAYENLGNNGNSYQITNTVGEYNSIASGTKQMGTFYWGVSAGVRIYFGDNDFDHDGVPNRLDECPNDSGSLALGGCPDRDGDGIPDKIDRCPNLKGPLCTSGCPDSDCDCIANIDDECIDVPGHSMIKLGCPAGTAQLDETSSKVSIDYILSLKFPIGGDELDPKEKNILLSNILRLQTHGKNRKILIMDWGEYNQRGSEGSHSQSRAEYIRTLLTDKGIEYEEIITDNSFKTENASVYEILYSDADTSLMVSNDTIINSLTDEQVMSEQASNEVMPQTASDSSANLANNPKNAAPTRSRTPDPDRLDTSDLSITKPAHRDLDVKQRTNRPAWAYLTVDEEAAETMIREQHNAESNEDILNPSDLGIEGKVHVDTSRNRNRNPGFRHRNEGGLDTSDLGIEGNIHLDTSGNRNQNPGLRHRNESPNARSSEDILNPSDLGIEGKVHVGTSRNRNQNADHRNKPNRSKDSSDSFLTNGGNAPDSSDLDYSDLDKEMDVSVDIMSSETIVERTVRFTWDPIKTGQIDSDYSKDWYVVLLKHGIDCPPSTERVTTSAPNNDRSPSTNPPVQQISSTIWRCGNGKLIRVHDERLNKIMNASKK